MQNNITTIKIIGGKFRGKILHSTLLPQTRPTKAILKESIFNTLQDFIQGKVFVEMFAGYGSVGFEALSRGAKRVIFIEKNNETFKILLKNIKLFEGHNISAYNKDSMLILKDIIKEVDILYFDPPFGSNGEYYIELLNILETANLKNKILIFEHISTFTMPQNISNTLLYKTRKFGKSSISYYWDF